MGQHETLDQKTIMNGKFKLTDDFALSHHTDPLHNGRVVRDINFTPADKRLPDVAVCRIFSSREDAEKILVSMQSK